MTSEPSRTLVLALAAIASVVVAHGSLALASTRVVARVGQQPAHIEAVLRVKDLQVLRRRAARERRLLLRSGVGRAHYSDEGQPAGHRLDWLAALERVTELASPEGQPVPASFILFSRGDELGMVGRVAVQAGFDGRLRAASLPDEGGLCWVKAAPQEAGDGSDGGQADGKDAHGPSVGGQHEIGIAGVRIRAAHGGDGWLHFTAGQATGVEPADLGELAWTSEATRAAFGDADAALAVFGGGLLPHLLTETVEQPVLRLVAQSVRAIVVAWRTDGIKTSALSLLLDFPLFGSIMQAQPSEPGDGADEEGRAAGGDGGTDDGEQTGEAVRPATEDASGPTAGADTGHPSIHWGPDLTQFVSVAMTQSIVRAVAPLLERLRQPSGGQHGGKGGQGPAPAIPDGLRAALAQVSGRLEVVSFGSPGDWAAVVPFADEATSADMAPLLQRWLAGLAGRPVYRIGGVYELESDDVAAAVVLHARPGNALQGVRVTHVGPNVLVVRQRSRLQQILALQRRAPSATPPVPGQHGQADGRLDIPLTAPVRELLVAPAAVRGYAVLGNDGAWEEWLSWGASYLAAVWRRRQRQEGGQAVSAAVDAAHAWLARLPATLTLSGYCWMMTYDVAFAADIRDGVFVLDLRASEI